MSNMKNDSSNLALLEKIDKLNSDLETLNENLTVQSVNLNDFCVLSDGFTVNKSEIFKCGKTVMFYIVFTVDTVPTTSSKIILTFNEGYKTPYSFNNQSITIANNSGSYVPSTTVSAFLGAQGISLYNATGLTNSAGYIINGTYLCK